MTFAAGVASIAQQVERDHQQEHSTAAAEYRTIMTRTTPLEIDVERVQQLMPILGIKPHEVQQDEYAIDRHRKLMNAPMVQGSRVSADGEPEYKAGGLTIDWSTVAAVNVDTTLPDCSLVHAGAKYLRYGQVLAQIVATGLYGPFDPTSVLDGRSALTPGAVFIVDQTILQYSAGSPANSVSNDQVDAIAGGYVNQASILSSGTAPHSLAAGPTMAELFAAMPRLQLTGN